MITRNDTAGLYLGKILVARTAQGTLVAVGRCVSYCDSPMVNIQAADGTQTHWRANMCEELPVSEDVRKVLFP